MIGDCRRSGERVEVEVARGVDCLMACGNYLFILEDFSTKIFGLLKSSLKCIICSGKNLGTIPFRT
jgi:hypothetical protein